jgi:hypothetical protein
VRGGLRASPLGARREVQDFFEYTIEQKWYVVVDDLVGGWAISTVDKPLSEVDFRDRSVVIVADTLSKEIAEYLVYLHEDRRLS